MFFHAKARWRSAAKQSFGRHVQFRSRRFFRSPFPVPGKIIAVGLESGHGTRSIGLASNRVAFHRDPPFWAATSRLARGGALRCRAALQPLVMNGLRPRGIIPARSRQFLPSAGPILTEQADRRRSRSVRQRREKRSSSAVGARIAQIEVHRSPPRRSRICAVTGRWFALYQVDIGSWEIPSPLGDLGLRQAGSLLADPPEAGGRQNSFFSGNRLPWQPL